MRRRIIDGTDRSSLAAVNVANAIINRLAKLLMHLSQNYPSDTRGRFLNGGRPNRPLIAISGHSPGAGHAAVMGKALRAAPRAHVRRAPWQDRNQLTASYYGFNH